MARCPLLITVTGAEYSGDMTAAALIVYAVFGLLAAVVRPWLQHRRTGDFGFRCLSSYPYGKGRLALPLLLVGALACPLALVADFTGIAAGRKLFVWAPAHAAGLVVMVSGGLLLVWSQLEMGASWRVGVRENERTPLVTAGLFGLVRNPIYLGASVFVVGAALVTPNVIALAGLACGLAGLEFQVRYVEEPYLRRIHGDDYDAYASRVGRFVPGIGRSRGPYNS